MQDWIIVFFESARGEMVLRAIAIVIAGLLVAFLARTALERILRARSSAAHAAVVSRLVWYLMLAVVVLAAIKQLGFDMSVLLGAAGILTVALGFASQASASNLISGLFLLGEQPFVAGDIIKVGETMGEVISIDLLSVKLRTFDNLFVRVPNEKLLKSDITTLTRFPIRRFDLMVGVAYKEDLGRVREVLLATAERNPLCLDEPEPLMIFQGFGDSAQEVQFSVWAARENWLDLRNSFSEEVKRAFDEAGIEIPFPHRSLYTGKLSDPFPVRVELVPNASSATPT